MNTFNEHDIVYHRSVGGFHYIGVVVKKIDYFDAYKVMWWMRSRDGSYDSYWSDSDADADKITLIGPMPEGVEWDVE
jgi:hypothetical protein